MFTEVSESVTVKVIGSHSFALVSSILTVVVSSSLIVPTHGFVPIVALLGAVSTNEKLSLFSSSVSLVVFTTTVAPVLPAGILA